MDLKRILFSLFLSFIAYSPILHADWLPFPPTIPLGSSSGIVYDTTITYNPSSGTNIAAWNDSTTNAPYFSVFDGTNWTIATLIPQASSSGVYKYVNLTYDATHQTVVAAWTDSTDFQPYFSVFNGTSWTNAFLIPLGTSSGVLSDVSLSYDAARGTVIAAWNDNTTNAPYFSVFNGTNWTVAALIPGGSSSGVYDDVTLTYDTATSTVIAAWADVVTNAPFYSIYNGVNWSTALSIPLGTSNGVVVDVILVYDEAGHTVIGAWGDSATNLIYYSIFNGTTWTTPNLVPLGVSTGVYSNVGLAYSSDSKSVFLAWSDNITFLPYYSVFLGGSWSIGAPIPVFPSSGVDYNVNLSFNSNSHQMVAVWANYPDNADPYYSLFLFTAPAPPSDFIGVIKKNQFLNKTECSLKAKWTQSPTPDVVLYRIYKDGVVVSEVLATSPLVFKVKCLKNCSTLGYEVAAVNSDNVESSRVALTRK